MLEQERGRGTLCLDTQAINTVRLKLERGCALVLRVYQTEDLWKLCRRTLQETQKKSEMLINNKTNFELKQTNESLRLLMTSTSHQLFAFLFCMIVSFLGRWKAWREVKAEEEEHRKGSTLSSSKRFDDHHHHKQVYCPTVMLGTNVWPCWLYRLPISQMMLLPSFHLAVPLSNGEASR
jgi:hypothetical protein